METKFWRLSCFWVNAPSSFYSCTSFLFIESEAGIIARVGEGLQGTSSEEDRYNWPN